mmetsp:Transcript_9816/g.29370  ORF Transcript_9816/g.29370 Transcript_9816/m.29370 type:complete len:249 (+) Transcript_9816:41-787(+)
MEDKLTSSPRNLTSSPRQRFGHQPMFKRSSRWSIASEESAEPPPSSSLSSASSSSASSSSAPSASLPPSTLISLAQSSRAASRAFLHLATMSGSPGTGSGNTPNGGSSFFSSSFAFSCSPAPAAPAGFSSLPGSDGSSSNSVARRKRRTWSSVSIQMAAWRKRQQYSTASMSGGSPAAGGLEDCSSMPCGKWVSKAGAKARYSATKGFRFFAASRRVRSRCSAAAAFFGFFLCSSSTRTEMYVSSARV